MDGVAFLADETRAVIARWNLPADRPAALGAEIHGRSLSDAISIAGFETQVAVMSLKVL
jgi:hypothetical protein